MSASSVIIPTFFILTLAKIGISPKGKVLKTLVEFNCVIAALLIGFPFSVSIFPPMSIKQGKDLEPEFKSYDKIYFSKGL